MIIGLSGYAGSGKDEVAKILVEEFGYVQMSFADRVREFLYELNPLIEVVDATINVRTIHGMKRVMQNDDEPAKVALPVRLRDAVDKFGWMGVRDTIYNEELRLLQQRCGTDCGRNLLGENVWVDATFRLIEPGQNVVLSSVRFPNEAKAIRDRGGMLWRIHRAGYGPVNDHPSETALDNYDYDMHIANNGTLGQLRDEIKLGHNIFTKGVPTYPV